MYPGRMHQRHNIAPRVYDVNLQMACKQQTAIKARGIPEQAATKGRQLRQNGKKKLLKAAKGKRKLQPCGEVKA